MSKWDFSPIGSICALSFILSACITVDRLADGPKDRMVAKNIIYLIVDGMGFEHVKAARIYNGQPLSFEKFPCATKVSTCSAEGAGSDGVCDPALAMHVTDSAAAATAIATGAKVKNGAVSQRLGGGDMETVLEHMKRLGKSTGIIATKLFTDATPAAFAAHASDRGMTEEILEGIFQSSTPNVIMGADDELHRRFLKRSKVSYEMVSRASDLRRLAHEIVSGHSCSGPSCSYIYGGFGQHDMIPGVYKNLAGLPLAIALREYEGRDIPPLWEMTEAALSILSKNDNGFFLMVESSMPDMISHFNQQIDKRKRSPTAIEALIEEMMALEKTSMVLQDFIKRDPNTLLILTADHETGGLVIDAKKTSCLGQKGCVPSVAWTSKRYEESEESPVRHTGADVPLYAIGVGAARFCRERIDNTEITDLALAGWRTGISHRSP